MKSFRLDSNYWCHLAVKVHAFIYCYLTQILTWNYRINSMNQCITI